MPLLSHAQVLKNDNRILWRALEKTYVSKWAIMYVVISNLGNEWLNKLHSFYLYFTKRSSIADWAFALESRNPVDGLEYTTGSSILAFSSSSVAWVLILAIISEIIFGTAEINENELKLEHFLQRNLVNNFIVNTISLIHVWISFIHSYFV